MTDRQIALALLIAAGALVTSLASLLGNPFAMLAGLIAWALALWLWRKERD